jgi:excinuclease UvrABC ATPase subunit
MSGNKNVYFDTKKQAEDYVISQNCSMCKGEGLKSACAAEWFIMKTKDFKNSECIEDLFKAAGYKRIK